VRVDLGVHMTERVSKSISDLLPLVSDGEKRLFKAVARPDGNEPPFYEIATRGEFAEQPLWVNAPRIDLQPIAGRTGTPHVPLSSVGECHFRIDTVREAMADLYYVSTGIYLLSDSLLNVVKSVGGDAVEHSSAQVLGSHGAIPGFNVVMPTRVIDAVDAVKSDVTVNRWQPVPKIPRYVTLVRYDEGYVLRADAVEGVAHLVEPFSSKWLWRRSLIEAAAAAKVRGLLAVHTYDKRPQSEIRI